MALGIALVIVAAVVLHAVPVPRAVAVLMAFAGLSHVAQSWLVGSDGFTAAASTAIVRASSWARR